MTLIKYTDVARNTRGDSLPDYRLQVVTSAGAGVDIYSDGAGTRFRDGSGNVVNYATANPSGKVEFYWTPATGQILQVLDTSGTLVDTDADFADKYVKANLAGELPQDQVTDLPADLAAKAATADLTSSDADKGAGIPVYNAGAAYASGTVGAKLSETISVKDAAFEGGATGDGTTDDSEAIQATLDAAGALAQGGEVIMPRGTYNCGSTKLTVPQKVKLHLDGAKILSSATDAIEITLGSASTSGRVSGTGHSCIINHTGSGHAIVMNGAGESSANPSVCDVHIVGSSSGAGGLYSTKFNRLMTSNVKVNGYTNGKALNNDGTNAVTHFNPVLEACEYGVYNRSIFDVQVFSANAVQVFGGSIVGMSEWGYIDTTAGGSASENIGNFLCGVTFENNGQNGSATTGHAFIQEGVGTTIRGCYFEDYSGILPDSAIIVGDGSYAPQTTSIYDNTFATSGVNVLSNVNGQNTMFGGNQCLGTVTNFVNNGTGARGLVYDLGNRGAGVSNVFAGSDNGLDSVVIGAGAGLLNSQGATTRGYGFNTLSGLDQDLRIRTRAGGTYAVRYDAADGTFIAYVDSAGAVGCQSVEIGGNKVVGSRGAALPADATDLASVIALANAIKARLKATGGHGLVAD